MAWRDLDLYMSRECSINPSNFMRNASLFSTSSPLLVVLSQIGNELGQPEKASSPGSRWNQALAGFGRRELNSPPGITIITSLH
jgi:hypothetical protein